MKYDMKDYKTCVGTDGYPLVAPFEVGEVVLDSLTFTVTTIIEMTPILDKKDKDGNIVIHDKWKGDWIKVDSKYLAGCRYEWEITKIKKRVAK